MTRRFRICWTFWFFTRTKYSSKNATFIKELSELIVLPATDKLGEDLVHEEDNESAGKDEPATFGWRQKVEVKMHFLRHQRCLGCKDIKGLI